MANHGIGLINKIENTFLGFTNRYLNKRSYFPMQIDITNACNLRCDHCYHAHHKNVGGLKLDDWYLVIDQYHQFIEKFGFEPHLTICGGEPLTSPFLFPVIEHFQELTDGAPVFILTNGTIINDILIQKFKKIPNLKFQISIDGPTADTHDRLRGEGSFHKSIETIKRFKEEGIDYVVQAVLSERTSHFIPNFFNLAKFYGFPMMNFTRFIGKGYGEQFIKDGHDRPLQPLDLKKALEDIVVHSFTSGIKTSTTSPLYSLVAPGLGSRGGRWNSVVIDYKGNIKASSRVDLKLGHVFEQGIEDVVLRHPISVGLRKKKINKCGECPHFESCGGDRNAAFVESGSFLGEDPGCWLSLNEEGL